MSDETKYEHKVNWDKASEVVAHLPDGGKIALKRDKDGKCEPQTRNLSLKVAAELRQSGWLCELTPAGAKAVKGSARKTETKPAATGDPADEKSEG